MKDEKTKEKEKIMEEKLKGQNATIDEVTKKIKITD